MRSLVMEIVVMEEVNATARRYITIFGDEAIVRIEADLSRAIGRTDWDDYARLRKVKERVQRLQMLAVAETRLARFMRRARLLPQRRPSASVGSDLISG